jgi:hypothetical protein
MCSCRAGAELDIWPLEGADPSWSPERTVLDLPEENVKGYVLGKGGGRLLQISEEVGVVAVFVNETTRPEPKPLVDLSLDSLAVGDLVEAKFGGKPRAFEAKVLNISADKVTLKWTYDDDVPEEELDKSELIRKLPPPQPKGLELAEGDLVEAKFGGKGERLFEAKILKVSDSKITLKWTYDDGLPEEEVDKADVVSKVAPSKPKPQVPAVPEVGDLVEAKFGGKDRWFEAKVLSVTDKVAKVKWTYDDDVPEEDVDLSNIKCRPPVATCKFHIYGPVRGRMELELKVLRLVEAKVPGFVSNKPRATDETDGLGFSVVPLHNNGELKGKVTGKGGTVRLKLSKASGAGLEYIGNDAWLVGSGPERAKAKALLDLVQTSQMGAVEEVPEVLEDICTSVVVPADASPMVMGKGRATMNSLEDETGVLSFWAPGKKVEVPEPAKLEVAKDSKLEGLFKHPKRGDEWYECKVLEVLDDGKKVKVQWDYDPDEKTEIDVATECRKILTGKALEERIAGEALASSKTLVIFGLERARTMVCLRVKAAVEPKFPGTFPSGKVASSSSSDGEAFGVVAVEFTEDELSRCGNDRRAAAGKAAGCICEQVGKALFLAGSGAERSRCSDYVKWLAMDKRSVPQGRDDVSELIVSAAKQDRFDAYDVDPIEKEFETLCFFDDGASSASKERRMVVIGQDAAKRDATIAKLKELQEQPKRKSDSWAPAEESTAKRKFVVSKDEEDKRAKRAARFAAPPPAK